MYANIPISEIYGNCKHVLMVPGAREKGLYHTLAGEFLSPTITERIINPTLLRDMMANTQWFNCKDAETGEQKAGANVFMGEESDNVIHFWRSPENYGFNIYQRVYNATFWDVPGLNNPAIIPVNLMFNLCFYSDGSYEITCNLQQDEFVLGEEEGTTMVEYLDWRLYDPSGILRDHQTEYYPRFGAGYWLSMEVNQYIPFFEDDSPLGTTLSELEEAIMSTWMSRDVTGLDDLRLNPHSIARLKRSLNLFLP